MERGLLGGGKGERGGIDEGRGGKREHTHTQTWVNFDVKNTYIRYLVLLFISACSHIM